MRGWFLVPIAVLMGGCESPLERFRTYDWVRPPGYTDQDFAYHDKACRDAVKPYRWCMEDLGYRERTQPAEGRKPG